MSQICVQIPPLQVKQTIGLEVNVNGRKRLMNYRVESLDWSMEQTAERRIERLRRFIRGYDKTWELVQIGQPSEQGLIPVMFRQRPA